MSWKSYSAVFWLCKLEPQFTITQEPMSQLRMTLVCIHILRVYLLQMEEDDRLRLWTKYEECVWEVEENCIQIKSRYIYWRWQNSLNLFPFKWLFISGCSLQICLMHNLPYQRSMRTNAARSMSVLLRQSCIRRSWHFCLKHQKLNHGH